MRMSGTEARHLLAPWVRDHRRVWCMFASPGLNDARSGILWAVDDDFVTIRHSDGIALRSIDLHIPFADVAIEYFQPTESPLASRPAQALECFDGALSFQEPELSDSGAPIELTWTLWIVNPASESKSFAVGFSAH